MISATPNSVRWDQVNRVSYRFQALNFQSDVLEALVLNSPPLSRRTRRKSIIRVTDSSGRRVEFLRSRSLERRSQSFDEGITNFAKHDTKLCQESTPRDDRYSRRIDNGGVSREVDTRQKGNVVIKACADVDNELEENPPEFVKKHSDVSPVANSVSHLECGCGKNDQLHDSGILCDRRDEDLENCSKEYLIQLVKELRSKVRDLSESRMKIGKTSDVADELHQDCSGRCEVYERFSKLVDGNRKGETNEEFHIASPINNKSFNYQDCMAVNMRQLESEVIRTRKIASMFENELSGLKSRFSSLLGTSSTVEGRLVTPSNTQRKTAKKKGDIEITEHADSNDNFLRLNLDSYPRKIEKTPNAHSSNLLEVTVPNSAGASQ